MKKIMLIAGIVTLGSFFVSANASGVYSKTDKAIKKQIRKERRIERKESWLHSADPGTRIQFFSDFPDAQNVSWKEGMFAEATFLDGTVEKTSYYDFDNGLVGTTTRVAFSALPEKAQQKIGKKYPGYYATEVILLDDNKVNESDMNLFATPFADEDNYFPVLTDGTKKLILKVTIDGDVSLFKEIN